MKKAIVLFIITAIFVIGTVPTFAESLSLTTYSDADLISLLEDVQSEIVARHIEKTALLKAGTYIGGRDIPAGNYILTSAGVEGDSGIVSLRSVNDPLDDWPSKLYEFKDYEDSFSVYITVEEGDTLELPYPYNLTISAGVQFR